MSVNVAPDSLSASWLASRLGEEPGRIEAMRRDGELIGFRPEGAWEHYYPVWQFDDEWRPLASIPRIVHAARRAGLDENRLYGVLNARLGGQADRRRLADLLREGREDHVLEAVRSARP
jgi:hypothetical protein